MGARVEGCIRGMGRYVLRLPEDWDSCVLVHLLPPSRGLFSSSHSKVHKQFETDYKKDRKQGALRFTVTARLLYMYTF